MIDAVRLPFAVMPISGKVASELRIEHAVRLRFEIAEFAARPGQTYEICIRRYSGSDDVWYGVAWTLTSSLAIQAGDQVLAPLR